MPKKSETPFPKSAEAFAGAIERVYRKCRSECSFKAYTATLSRFFRWREKQVGEEQSLPALTADLVWAYRTELLREGKAAGSVNLALSILRRLADESAALKLISVEEVFEIRRVDRVPAEGVRLGNWLSAEQASAILALPEGLPRLQALRDRAIVGVLEGASIRRAECASLHFSHLQSRFGMWVIVDMVGKRRKKRSVIIPNWTKEYVDQWATAAGISNGPLFRRMSKHGTVQGEPLGPDGITDAINRWSKLAGIHFRAHDLRRTSADLMKDNGATERGIQSQLGHADRRTTEVYFQHHLNFKDPPCNYLGIVPPDLPPKRPPEAAEVRGARDEVRAEGEERRSNVLPFRKAAGAGK